jgi:hypothetical protein
MVNIPYHAARVVAGLNRKIYQRILPIMASRSVDIGERIPVTVYTMSCERDVPEQVACIYSFLKNVGIPNSFNIVSDGSHSERSKKLLKSISSCIKVLSMSDIVPPDLPPAIKAYAEKTWPGKKFAMMWSLPIDGPTIYTDSDILFFPDAAELNGVCRDSDDRPWYLPDLPGSLDERVLAGKHETVNPVNIGFILFKKPLDWKLAISRLEALTEPYDYFTDQTLIHLALHQAEARPFDVARYVLQVDDQFRYFDGYAGGHIALRHYVSTIRYKFWLGKLWQ